MTTKILALTDALGNLVRFRLMPGQSHDSVEVPPLIDGIVFDGLIADKAFDSNALVAELNDLGAKVVISQHPGPGGPADHRRLAEQKRGLALPARESLASSIICRLNSAVYAGLDPGISGFSLG